MDLEDLFKSKNQWSSAEFANMLEIARADGKTAFITMADPDSPEGLIARDYIDSHKFLPMDYAETTEEQIAEQGKRLLTASTSIDEKKKILMLLAHLGVYESYQIVKEYNQKPDKDLYLWAKMALDECRTFVKQNLSEETLTSLTVIARARRNDPCPCGSGKKFKKCCGS